MSEKEVLPGVFIQHEVRMPTVVQDYGIGVNGWHEGNALLTPVWHALSAIKEEGIEEYVKTYFYNPNGTFSFRHKLKHTNSRHGGMEYAYEHFLKPKMHSGMLLLDIGCGQGELGIWCATARVDYTGIDVALVNIGFCEAMKPCLKFLRPDSTEPIYLQRIMEDIDLEPDTFDVVFTSHSLEHVHDLDATFQQMFHYGRMVCGVVAAPKDDEPGEHMRKVTVEMLESYLGKYCATHEVHEMELENVFWGEAK